MANTITISKKEYQQLRTKASAFDQYLVPSIRKQVLKDFEAALKKTGLYSRKFIKDLVEARCDILEGNIKEISSLKTL